MEVVKMTAVRREARGKSAMRGLRAKGYVPAVFYGQKQDAMSISVSEHEMEGHFRNRHRVFELEVDGAVTPAYLKDVQFDTLTDRPVHVDFQRIDMNEKIALQVQMLFIGIPEGARRGGTLIKDIQMLSVRSLPKSIPEEFRIGVAHLDLGQRILARDLLLPEGCELNIPGDTMICHLPGEEAMAQMEEQMLAEAEAEVAAEGAAEAAKPSDGGGGGDS